MNPNRSDVVPPDTVATFLEGHSPSSIAHSHDASVAVRSIPPATESSSLSPLKLAFAHLVPACHPDTLCAIVKASWDEYPSRQRPAEPESPLGGLTPPLSL